MGWSDERHWPADSSGEKIWPPGRWEECNAREVAMRRGVGWYGPLDEDGYALTGAEGEVPLLDVLRENIAVQDSGEVDW